MTITGVVILFFVVWCVVSLIAAIGCAQVIDRADRQAFPRRRVSRNPGDRSQTTPGGDAESPEWFRHDDMGSANRVRKPW